jgi:radical SAM superfamily enzyme YgiQ (UPF0313 family)
VRVLLVSTYELGHQPLHVASPAAALAHAGHEVRCLDLAVERLEAEAVAWADAVALSVPMHTAMRLALRAVERLRASRPELPLCLYGLYALVGRDQTLPAGVHRLVAGEYEQGLIDWAGSLATADEEQPAGGSAVAFLGRSAFRVPARRALPPLEHYAHLATGGEERLVGYTEASHGCAHRCRHCPVPAVYDGRTRIVERDVVLADVAQLVERGARHITFGDPDFLNGPHHAMRVVRAVHGQFPELTFDCTVKVEHVLRHRHLWEELAAAGCLFVVSALEVVNDRILELLDKGHTAADAAEAIAVLREHGIEMRPSFLPFTPWTTIADVVDILDFVIEHDLVANVDPVQYTIRLLVPEGSLLLDGAVPGLELGPWDPDRLTFAWSSPDPRVDELQRRLAALVEAAVPRDEPIESVFLDVNALVRSYAGGEARSGAAEPVGARTGAGQIATGSVHGRPRLTEPWFC